MEINDDFYLYHITIKDNKNSIMKEGIIPNFGDRKKRCKIDCNSTDKWISLCKECDIKKWSDVLYDDNYSNDIIVFKVNVKGKIIKVRKWHKPGWEYGCWETISPENISLYKV